MTDGHIVLLKEDSFLKECWSWYVIGVVVILARFAVRFRTVGWRNFQGDDWFALLSLGTFTADAVLVDIVYHTGTNVDVPPAMVDHLSDEEIATVRYGSQCQLAAWYTYTGMIWCMKFMMLFFYRRLTMGTFQGKMIHWLFWLCGITYIAVFFTITLGCYPTARNWQVRPLPSKTCTFKPQNFYVGAILNVLTDAIILCIPIPLLWKLKVPLSKKLAIGALLSSGLFVITAAIVRAALTLGSTPSALNINRWGVRETIVGMLTVNIPILRPMFTKNFWKSSAYMSSDGTRSKGTWRNKSSYGPGTFELRSSATSRERVHGDAASTGSQDDIIKKNSHDVPGIVVTEAYEVRSDHRDLETGPSDWDSKNDKPRMTTHIRGG